MTEPCDVAVLGAGPAGIAAALAASAHGCSVVVVDAAARAGGQLWRQPDRAGETDARLHPPSHARGEQMLSALRRSAVELWSDAQVFGAAPGRFEVEQRGAVRVLNARRTVLATGARDLVAPFPGWTLPGVLTAGGVQVLVRGHALRPGRRAVVAGSGPLLLPAVAALLAAGCDVAGCYEAATWPALARAGLAALCRSALRRELGFYRRLLRASGVRLRAAHGIVEVRGDGRVEQAVVAPLDRTGRPRLAAARTHDVDLVCVGNGLQPQVEVAAALGCALRFDAVLGGVYAGTDDRCGTSVPGIAAAGECAGVAGAAVATIEGKLAGLAAAAALGRPVAGAELAQLARQRARARAGARALLRWFAPRPGWLATTRSDTIVCRCEEVTRAELERAAARCGRELRAVKLQTRCGMGACQGRTCARIAAELIGADPIRATAAVQWPLAPIPLALLAQTPIPPSP